MLRFFTTVCKGQSAREALIASVKEDPDLQDKFGELSIYLKDWPIIMCSPMQTIAEAREWTGFYDSEFGIMCVPVEEGKDENGQFFVFSFWSHVGKE